MAKRKVRVLEPPMVLTARHARTVAFDVAKASPSLNAFAYKTFWTERALKKTWVTLLYEQWVLHASQRGPVFPLHHGHPVSVSVVRYGRLLDEDNLHGGLKPLWDACRLVGWITDDSPAWLTRDVQQAVGSPARTSFTFVLKPTCG